MNDYVDINKRVKLSRNTLSYLADLYDQKTIEEILDSLMKEKEGNIADEDVLTYIKDRLEKESSQSSNSTEHKKEIDTYENDDDELQETYSHIIKMCRNALMIMSSVVVAIMASWILNFNSTYVCMIVSLTWLLYFLLSLIFSTKEEIKAYDKQREKELSRSGGR